MEPRHAVARPVRAGLTRPALLIVLCLVAGALLMIVLRGGDRPGEYIALDPAATAPAPPGAGSDDPGQPPANPAASSTAAPSTAVPPSQQTTGADSGTAPPEGTAAPDGTAAPEGTAAPDGSAAADGAATVIVHVAGEVTAPGIVTVPAGARVSDAVTAAGGPTGDADLSRVNLARRVTDGEQILVPSPDDPDPATAEPAPGAAPDAGGTSETAPANGLIDLNTATAEQLDELPGVGPAIAQRIIDHRESAGPFTAVDDLLEVSGIGPATLEKIAPQATV